MLEIGLILALNVEFSVSPGPGDNHYCAAQAAGILRRAGLPGRTAGSICQQMMTQNSHLYDDFDLDECWEFLKLCPTKFHRVLQK